MISNSNSLCRERDAQSSARRFTSRHLRYRAVQRANRTLKTANNHDHSATSSTTEPPDGVPSLLWQCFCVDWFIDDHRLGRKDPNMMIIGVDYHPSSDDCIFNGRDW